MLLAVPVLPVGMDGIAVQDKPKTKMRTTAMATNVVNGTVGMPSSDPQDGALEKAGHIRRIARVGWILKTFEGLGI